MILNLIGRERSRALLLQVGLIGGLLLFWQTASGDPRHGALLDELFVGTPGQVWSALVKGIADGVLLKNAAVTLQAAVIGFIIGSLSAMPLGFLLGATKVGRMVFAPLVYVAYSVPRYGIAPLFIIWFGVGIESKVAFVTLVVFFYTFFNAYEGAREVDQELIDTCRLMKASRWQILRKVVIPSSIVWVALGLKIAAPHAFSAAVLGEILSGYFGLGVLIRTSASSFDAGAMFAATLTTAALAVLLTEAVAWIARRMLRWRDTDSI